MRLVYQPNFAMKSLDTLSHTFVSMLHAIGKDHEVLMVFNSASRPALLFPRLLGKRIAINTGCLEWKRGKREA